MLLLKNAVIASMDDKRPFARAALIDGERFVYVGDEAGAANWLKGARTEELDLQGRFVIPGFIDSHMHFIHYVKAKSSVDLFGCDSLAELKNRMRRGLEKYSPTSGRFIMGEGWNQELFSDEKRFPNRHDLDEISRDYPIIIMRSCFHIGVLNSKAMELIGLDRETAKLHGDFAELDEQGEPNGVIKENYLDDTKASLPSMTLAELLEEVERAQYELFALGITGVHSDDFKSAPDNGPYELVEGLAALSQSGKLKLRISEQALLTEQETLEGYFARGGAAAARDCRVSTVKILADGSLGARTAFMREPYADVKDSRGLAIYEQAELDRLVLTAQQHNMPVAIHVIGDGAAEMALDAIEKALAAVPEYHPRHGLVHCQLMGRDLLERMQRLGVQAHTQPVFINSDMHIAADRLGDERVKDSYPWRSMLELGIRQSFGTDCPVEGLNPLAGIYCAVSRRDFLGRGPFLPEQAISLHDAIYAYTAAGAYASGDEKDRGMIKAGMLADFVVMDRNLFDIPEAELLQAKVLGTWIGGRCVYRAEGFGLEG